MPATVGSSSEHFTLTSLVKACIFNLEVILKGERKTNQEPLCDCNMFGQFSAAELLMNNTYSSEE